MKLDFDHLSHSFIATFDCPRQGYRLIINEERRDEKTLALVLGSSFHKLMELALWFRRWDEPSLLHNYWSVLFRENCHRTSNWRDKKPSKKQRDAEEQAGHAMIDTVLATHSWCARRPYEDEHGPWVERELLVRLPNTVLGMKCLVDAVYEEPDGSLLVVDWKTSRRLPKPAKDPSLSSYKDQIALYSWAVQTVTHRPVSRALLVFPRLGQEVQFTPSSSDVLRQTARVERVTTMIKNYDKLRKSNEAAAVHQVFPITPHYSTCQWCPFKSECSGPDKLERTRKQSYHNLQHALRESVRNG